MFETELAIGMGRTVKELRASGITRLDLLSYLAYKTVRIEALADTDDEGKSFYHEYIKWH